MYRHFSKPPGQASDENSRDYPQATSVEGDYRRYAGLKVPVGGSLFAAYDPLDIKSAKYLVVISSEYLYTRSFFWPDVTFLTAPKLDWGQSAGMTISVRRTISIDPQVIVFAGSNDHLQSRGLLAHLTDRSMPINEVIMEAVRTLLSAMNEVEALVQRHFTNNELKIIFVLSLGTPHCLNPYSLCIRWSSLWQRDDSA